MKSSILFQALTFFFFSLTISAQNYDYPSYRTRNTMVLEISRIERNDTAVYLDAEVYSNPGEWVQLSSGTTLKGSVTGKIYKLVSSEGFNLDEKVIMPDSGGISFRLRFEPTDKKDIELDLREGNAPDDFVISGIRFSPPDTIGKIHCKLSGKVIDRPQSSRLILIPDGKDIRTNNYISIPIRDGKFEYDLYSDSNIAYNLLFGDEVFKGIFYETIFFAENGPVNFILYPSENDPRFIIETQNPLMLEKMGFDLKCKQKFDFSPIYSRIDSLDKIGKYESEALKALWLRYAASGDNYAEKDKLYKERDRLEKSGEAYTPEARKLIAEGDKLRNERNAWKLRYIEENPSLASLFLLKQMCEDARSGDDLTPQIALFEKVFAKRYSGHPYSEDMQMLSQSTRLKVGEPYLDIVAPDLTGKQVRVGDCIRGKIALIDLWASWCGPCRRNSKSMMPLYLKYKDRGFTVIGIAREKGNTMAMEKAIEQDGYPWINLVELDDAGQIWLRHRLQKAAGGTFLVGTDGRILAIDPDAEEVEAVLKKNL